MTTLTEYFTLNREDSYAMKFLYREIPEHYRWISGKKAWQRRKQRGQVGRIVYAHPAEGERYFLRVLLNHVRGATSFENLRTVAGIMYPTFRETCEKRGLIERDQTIDDCLSEATTFQMPAALRRLFATILVFCEATNICGLWDKHKESFFEDYSRNNPNTTAVEQMVLRDIRDLIQSMGKDIRNYDLPKLNDMGNIFSINIILKNILLSGKIHNYNTLISGCQYSNYFICYLLIPYIYLLIPLSFSCVKQMNLTMTL